MAILIHIPTWGWTPKAVTLNRIIQFQPTPPYGDEQVFPSLFLFFMHFNPHPRMGMNYAVFTAPPVARSFQPTPPHGDEHQQYLFKKKRMEITTHTPVWGWTQIRLKARPKCNYFNPHPRMGMNRWPASRKGDIFCISTHTPAWGMNSTFRVVFLVLQHFNSHPRMGMNALLLLLCICSLISIHTPVWGWTYVTT